MYSDRVYKSRYLLCVGMFPIGIRICLLVKVIHIRVTDVVDRLPT